MWMEKKYKESCRREGKESEERGELTKFKDDDAKK